MLIDAYRFIEARIEEIVREAPRAVSIRLSCSIPYTFDVGQHAVVRVRLPDDSKVVRQYSFSAPSDGNTVWLTVVQENEGLVSSWCNHTARVGDIVELSQPFTGPLVQAIPRGDICIIAGGSGIAPLMAWVRKLRSNDQPFTMLYSTRSSEQCFTHELQPVGNETITIRLTDIEPRLSANEITAALTESTTVLVCGSRTFVVAMRRLCETVVPTERIHSEAFTL